MMLVDGDASVADCVAAKRIVMSPFITSRVSADGDDGQTGFNTSGSALSSFAGPLHSRHSGSPRSKGPVKIPMAVRMVQQ